VKAEPRPDVQPEPEEVKPEEVKPEKPRGSEAQLTKKATEQYIAGNFGPAEGLYKQALAANRGYAPAHKGLGFLYQRVGNKAKAIESLRTYLKLSPGAKDADAVKKRLEQLGGA
jgi:Tfp pilus assembly protein PilF